MERFEGYKLLPECWLSSFSFKGRFKNRDDLTTFRNNLHIVFLEQRQIISDILFYQKNITVGYTVQLCYGI